MIQPLLNFSKQWPRALVTLSLGMLVLWIMNAAFPIDLSLVTVLETLVSQKLSEQAYIQLIFVGLVSYTLGVTALLLGESVIRFPENYVSRTRLNELKLEVAIFETANAMLIERYQRTRFLADVVGGFSAALLIGCIALAVRAFVSLILQLPVPPAAPGWEVYAFTYFMLAIVSGCIYLARRSLQDFKLLVDDVFPELSRNHP